MNNTVIYLNKVSRKNILETAIWCLMNINEQWYSKEIVNASSLEEPMKTKEYWQLYFQDHPKLVEWITGKRFTEGYINDFNKLKSFETDIVNYEFHIPKKYEEQYKKSKAYNNALLLKLTSENV